MTRGRLDPNGRLTTECGRGDQTESEASASAAASHAAAATRHASVLLRAGAANALPIVVDYTDTADAGFFDPTSARLAAAPSSLR